MNDAAEALDFEQAAALRDQVRALSVLSKNQKVIAGICADTDVWGVYTGPARAGCAVLHIENGDLLGRRVEVLPAAEDDAALLDAVVTQYYLDRERAAPGDPAPPAGGGHGHSVRPADGALRPCRHPPCTPAGPAPGVAGHRQPQCPGGGGARHLRRRAHRRDAPAFAGAGGAARPAPPHGELRHLPHRRRRPGGQHGGVRGRPAPEAGLPPVPDQDLRRSPTTTAPWRRCWSAGSAGIWTATRSSPPSPICCSSTAACSTPV